MIGLAFEMRTGHFSYPGYTENMAPVGTAPVPHPSNVRGMLENICALPPQTLEGEFAYGEVRPPGGSGLLLRRAHVEVSGLGDAYKAARYRDEPIKTGAMGSAIRVQKLETLLELRYRVYYRGPLEARLRAGLNGEHETWGVLSLGTSDNTVLDLHEATGPARWVVPGEDLRLILKSKRGYDTLDPTYQTYALSPLSELPEAAWIPCI